MLIYLFYHILYKKSIVYTIQQMKVIFAQGNPGSDYAHTRHNTGWAFVDAYADKNQLEFTAKTKFKADIAELNRAGEKCLLVKPTTYYNDAGLCARALADFYKLAPEDFLIVYDELALPLGTLRTRYGGSSAGNNGIKSLNTHLGEGTARLRIGIFDADIRRDALSSVLGTFTTDEIAKLRELEPKVFAIFDEFIIGRLTETTYK